MGQVIWSPEALDDVDAIAAYIARDSPYHAARFAQKLIDSTDRLASWPINYEYGLKVLDAPTAAAINQDITDYAELGALVPLDVLNVYSESAAELRDLYKAQERAVRRADTRLRGALRAAADELTRLRLAGGPMHTVFAATILYLLAKHGPMPTTELHPRVEAMHPDLCDNSVDRVIDGKRFGKKWKHAVRTAQPQLKKRGQIELNEDNWTLVGKSAPSNGERQ